MVVEIKEYKSAEQLAERLDKEIGDTKSTLRRVPASPGRNPHPSGEILRRFAKSSLNSQAKKAKPNPWAK